MKNLTNHFVILLLAITFQANAQTFEVCEKNKLKGVCDEKGKVLIPQVYQSIYPFYNYQGRFLVELNKKYGVLDDKNSIVLPIEYEVDMEYANPFVIDGGQAYFDSTSLIILKKKGKYGILTADLKPYAPFEYDYLGFFHVYNSTCFVAAKAKNYMLLDRNMKPISRQDYIDFASFYFFEQHTNAYAIFKRKDNQWVFVDETGKEHNEALALDETGNYIVSDKAQRVRYNNKFAAFNYQGGLIAQGYDQMSRFVPLYPDNSFVYASISIKGRYGVLKSDGREVVKPLYDHIDPIYITGQVVKVSLNGKVGVVDLNAGKELIPPKFDDIWIFDWLKGITYVTNAGKCALISHKGELLTDFVFDGIQPYQDDLYGAKRNGKWGYINLVGKVIIPFEYDNTEGFFNEDMIPLKKGGKYGYLNREGKEITEFKFDLAERFYDKDKAKILIGGKKGWIDKNGKEIWD